MKAGAMSVFLHFLETTSSFDQKGNFPTLKILCSLGLLLQQLVLTSPRPSMAKGPGPERTEKENRCDFAHSELGDLFPTPRARTRMSGGPVVHSSDLECRRLHRGTLAGGAVLSLGRRTPGDKPVVTAPLVQCTAEPGFPPALPAAVYFSESSNDGSTRSAQLSELPSAARRGAGCSWHLSWAWREKRTFFLTTLAYYQIAFQMTAPVHGS